MEQTLIFCVFLFLAGSQAEVTNVLEMYPAFKQLQDKVNIINNGVTGNTGKINSINSIIQAEGKKKVAAQIDFGSASYTATKGNVIGFNSPIENTGNAFDTATGKFRAPYDGNYLFNVKMCVINRDVFFNFLIKKDGHTQTSGFVGDNDWGDCSSATTVTNMKKNSMVWVEVGTTKNYQPVLAHVMFSFTGVLIN